jgi:hypothetical protein
VREVRAKVFDKVFVVIERMRGSQPRTDFLRSVISRGLKAQHAEAKKNAPKDGPGLGLAPLKQEGEAAYFDAATGAEIDDLMSKVGYWG